jgi:membrane-bound serine protease (ClpP class)
MNKALILPLILQLLAVVVIIAEIIIPSGGILAILATGLFTYSLYLVFTAVSAAAGGIFLLADLIMVPILIYFGIKFLARSPVTLRTMLSSKEGVTSQSPEQKAYVGRGGCALTDLRPSGVALIDGERLDVVTRGEYLEKQTDLVVVSVRGNQIIVKQKE